MSAANKTAAVNDIKRFAQSFRGIIALADDIEEVASLEQAAEQAKAKIEALRQEHDKVRQSFQHEIALARAQEAQHHSTKTNEAHAVLTQAKAQAGEIVGGANARAAQLVADAKSEAEKHERAVLHHRSTVAELEERHKALVASHDQLQRTHAQLTEQHRGVASDLARLKARL